MNPSEGRRLISLVDQKWEISAAGDNASKETKRDKEKENQALNLQKTSLSPPESPSSYVFSCRCFDSSGFYSRLLNLSTMTSQAPDIQSILAALGMYLMCAR